MIEALELSNLEANHFKATILFIFSSMFLILMLHKKEYMHNPNLPQDYCYLGYCCNQISNYSYFNCSPIYLPVFLLLQEFMQDLSNIWYHLLIPSLWAKI